MLAPGFTVMRFFNICTIRISRSKLLSCSSIFCLFRPLFLLEFRIYACSVSNHWWNNGSRSATSPNLPRSHLLHQQMPPRQSKSRSDSCQCSSPCRTCSGGHHRYDERVLRDVLHSSANRLFPHQSTVVRF